MSIRNVRGLLAGLRVTAGARPVAVSARFAVMASAFRAVCAWGINRLARRRLLHVAAVAVGRRELRARSRQQDPGGGDWVGRQAFTAPPGRGRPAGDPVRSPVPSDVDLWPGELPFTAWGQHEAGVLDLRVFDQGQWWVNRQQTPHLVTDMSVEYVEGVIGMLEANAEYFYFMTVRRDLVQRLGDTMLGRISTDTVGECAGVTPLLDLTPHAWLEGSPLMRALRKQLAIPRDGSTG